MDLKLTQKAKTRKKNIYYIENNTWVRGNTRFISTVVRHIFKLARCGYTLRVTSQASYSPEYITPTQKNHDIKTDLY
jgi:hypothetical protein